MDAGLINVKFMILYGFQMLIIKNVVLQKIIKAEKMSLHRYHYQK